MSDPTVDVRGDRRCGGHWNLGALEGDYEQVSTVLDGPTAETRNFAAATTADNPNGDLSIELADSVRMAAFPHERVGGGH